MIERNGSIWDTDARIVGHGVNTQGLMGAGIAVQFKERFPLNYEEYHAQCEDGILKPGSACGILENGTIVLNFASQDFPGKHAKYEWLFSSLLKGAQAVAEVRGNLVPGEVSRSTIAIPEIGCGIGGLKWKAVAKIILAVEAAVDNQVEFEVWHYGA